MKRREFMATVASVAAIPLLSSEKHVNVITYREKPNGTMERIEFEELRIGDVAQFVDPDRGPHAGRYRVQSAFAMKTGYGRGVSL